MRLEGVRPQPAVHDGQISWSAADDAQPRRPDGHTETACAKINFACRINVIWPVQSPRQKIMLPFFRKMWFVLAILPCQEGRLAIVTNVGWDAVDATERETSACGCGR